MIAALDGVTKRFGAATALEDASFAVAEGEAVAILGPNGAGKTTALALLLGLRRPDAGTVRLFGAEPRRPAARRGVGVTPQETAFPQALRVVELVELVRAHYPRPLATGELLDRFDLRDLARRQVGGLSGGQRRRVAVALAFAGAPRLVVLDEPTTGLDRDARNAVWAAIRDHGASAGTVLLTTHNLDEADALATRIVLVAAGRVVADGSVAEIKAAAGLTRVRFRASNGALPVEGATREGDHVRILTRDAGETVAFLVRRGVSLRDLEVRPATLEEAVETLETPR